MKYRLPQASRPEPPERLSPLDAAFGLAVFFLLILAAVYALPILWGVQP